MWCIVVVVVVGRTRAGATKGRRLVGVDQEKSLRDVCVWLG